MKISSDSEKILHILVDRKVKPGAFIKVYRRNSCNLDKTINYFLNYKNLEFKYDACDLNYDFTRNNWNSSQDVIDFVLRNKIGLLSIGDDDYPDMLRQIHLPPLLLFFKGDRIKKMEFSIAIVGSRKCTAYGKEAAMYISKNLSEMGIIIVSGLAAGIDSFAHRAALEGKGGSIGVLGCGIDLVYPPENRVLYEKIPENGSIITEFLPGTPPLKSNFPVRNRIISGLCQGVIVIEAGERSGAIITCEIALKQNREVMAVPGSIFSPSNKGCHRLIKEGAKLVENIDDILDEFSIYTGKIFKTRQENKFSSKKEKENKDHDTNLNGNELRIYEYIGYKSKSIEDIVKYSGIEVKEVLRILAYLEINGLIKEDSFNKYSRLF
ncbi:MAG: DNA-processing protein DprA [Candidatus Humimicrobiaceae bacterium]|nr:DNA-processing protein DprA [Candidatus Humimicrobiaceae bacterium]